jgi:hypothetical protein
MDTMHGVAIPTRGEAATMDQCGTWPVIVPQWEAPDGTPRGVVIQALTFRKRMAAEQAATDGKGRVNAWRVTAEEVAAGVVLPAGLTVDALLDWNADVIFLIHRRILEIGGYAAARIADELARLAGGPAPDVDGGLERHPDDVGGDAGPAPGPDAGEPGQPDG